jgi:hypothetical protein
MHARLYANLQTQMLTGEKETLNIAYTHARLYANVQTQMLTGEKETLNIA